MSLPIHLLTKTMGQRIIVSRVGVADIRKPAKKEFVTELAIKEGKRKLEGVGMSCRAGLRVWEGAGGGSQELSRTRSPMAECRKGGCANAAHVPEQSGMPCTSCTDATQPEPEQPSQDHHIAPC